MMLNSHSLLRRFENELNVGEHHLEWTIRGEDFFFRPRAADIETIWCGLECADFGRQLMFPRQSKKVIHRIKKQISSNYVRKYYPIAEDCEMFLFGLSGLVRFRQVEGLLGVTLPCENVPALNLLSSSPSLSDVIQCVHPRIEKIRHAICCSLSERCWSNINWPYGTHQQLRILLRAMATLIRQPEHGMGQWRFQLRNRFDSAIFLENSSVSGIMPDKTIYEAFLQCLRSYFPIRIERLVFCTSRGITREEIWPQAIISSGMPTQHEKLEALLTWRDFLRDKIPAAEIDGLLRPFC